MRMYSRKVIRKFRNTDVGAGSSAILALVKEPIGFGGGRALAGMEHVERSIPARNPSAAGTENTRLLNAMAAEGIDVGIRERKAWQGPRAVLDCPTLPGMASERLRCEDQGLRFGLARVEESVWNRESVRTA
jgi:hypothetical protein